MLSGILLLAIVIKTNGADIPNYKITSLEEAPYLMPSEGKQYQGIIIDILDEMSKYSNFTYDIVTPDDKNYGSEHLPGQWNGMIGDLVHKNLDIAAAPLTITSRRAKVVDFSHPFINAGLSILYKPPDPWANAEPLTVLFTPFTPGVWVMVAVVFIGISLFFYGIGRYSPYEDCSFVGKSSTYEGLTLFNSFLYTFSSLTWQSYTAAPRSISGRMMAGFWWMFTIMFIATYVANLTAFFLTQEPNTRNIPFMTFSELSQQKRASFGVVKSGSTYWYLQNSKKTLEKRLFAGMNKSDSNYVANINEAIDKVRTSNYAFIGEAPLLDYLASQPPCDLMVLDKLVVDRGYGFACNKNKTGLCNKLDEAILHLQEQQKIYEIKQKWMGSGCLKDAMKETSLSHGLPIFDSFGQDPTVAYEKAVTLRRFSGALLIALVGFILSIIALIGEVVYARRYGVPTPPRRMNVMNEDDREQIQNSFHD
ncbi:hypothetical protein SNE40_000122 [Patella caerulea]|uniref:Uncharacterized protein n=1 Tax=Patella caerulea TaxID=87958 RepID=A0AAN8KFY9_PATCE